MLNIAKNVLRAMRVIEFHSSRDQKRSVMCLVGSPVGNVNVAPDGGR